MSIDKKRFPNLINGDHASDLIVMQSAAGWYIGRSYWDKAGFEAPFSRESGYYGTQAEAKAELDAWSFDVRDCVENNDAYAKGTLPHPFMEDDYEPWPEEDQS